MALRAIGADMARYAAKAVGSTSAATTFFFLLLAGLRFATAGSAISGKTRHRFSSRKNSSKRNRFCRRTLQILEQVGVAFHWRANRME
jgi:hypothetical protein